jgi:hypothetical protein
VEKAFEMVLNEIYQLTVRNVIGAKKSTSIGPSRRIDLREEKSSLEKNEGCC